MIARCRDPKAISYPNYGGRGINVCSAWESEPGDFIKWAEENGLCGSCDIDRIDNDGDYSPGNCRVVSRTLNARNTRTNRFVVIDGRRITIAEAAEQAGLPYSRVRQRIVKLGWSPERAVSA